MLQSIVEGHPSFVNAPSFRYRRLLALDLFLDGCLYDHLPAFHVERGDGNIELRMFERRPSVKWNYPRMVSVATARKLFAGRQRPRITHDDEELVEACDVLLREGFWDSKIMSAVIWGSVGSVFLTFEIAKDGAGVPHVIFDTWRARDCTPVFDRLGELRSVRVQYRCLGTSFTSVGVTKDEEGEDIRQDQIYWFTRDYTVSHVTNFLPIRKDLYSPLDPKTFDRLRQDELRMSQHDLGFVPGHWFENLPGGDFPDGASTWACAADAMIAMDYTTSQGLRGLWYNQCPDLVVKGDLKNRETTETGSTIIRGPTNVLHFEAEKQGATGERIGGGDAKLLESTGQIFEQGRETLEQLRKFILETIAASRKDPDRMRTVAQSGRAMEILDADLMDLIQDLRLAYGDNGMLPLTRKLVRAAVKARHPAVTSDMAKSVESLALQWPRMYAPNAQEFLQTVQALQGALGGGAPKPGPGSPGGGTDKAAPTGGQELIDIETAKDYLAAVMDFPRGEDAGIASAQIPEGAAGGPIAETPPVKEPEAAEE